jgi:RNA polymerase sigma factor (sigma-70 family)
VEASALSHPVGLGRVSLAGPLLRLRTDDQLVALFRAGHDEAFGQIHDRYRARLFAYCRQMLGGSRGDAEDVLQDVFLRAYNSLRADRRDVALRAWLYRVAHNRCIDHLRRPTPAAEDIFDVNRGSAQERPEDAVERREDLRRLITDVRALPEQQRSALLMREMEGLSYNDLAAALGVTVPAIKSLLVRARMGLVEAVEARDTACVEIRDDLDSAFGRGVRVSGRARKHLKECAGCRDYRGALRSVEKQLNGLSPSSGPLGLIAKLLGIGGAGSGGGAAVLGGGGAGAAATATVTTGTAATVGASAVATKVVAVVAAAAVVGGGAATVQKVEHAVKRPATHERVVAKQPAAASVSVGAAVAERATKNATASSSSATASSGAAKRSLSHTGGLRPASHGSGGVTVTKLSTSATASAEAAPKLEPGSGGLEAPSDASTATPVDPGGSGTATSGTAQGATTGAGSTATAGAGSGEAAAGSATTAGGSGSATSGTATSGASGSTTSSTSSSAGATSGAVTSPSGTVSQGTTAPVAQGASATPTP